MNEQELKRHLIRSTRWLHLGCAAAVLALTAMTAPAAISFDAASSGGAGTALSVAWPHTVGSGANGMLVVGVSTERSTDNTPLTVTFGSQSLTKVPGSFAKSNATVYLSTELWYLPAPTAGLGTITVTFATSVANGIQCGAVSLFGVKQDAPEAVAVATGTQLDVGTAYSVPITTLTNGAWLVDIAANGSVGDSFVTTDMLERWDAAGSGQLAQAGATREVATAGMVTDTWTASPTSNRKSQSIAAFAPAPTVLSVSLTAPTNGQSFSIGTPLTATATVSSGTAPYTVRFFTDISGAYAQIGGNVTSSPYQVSLGTPAAATYHVYATVSDSASGTATSTTNSFTVNADQAPAVALAGPAIGTGFLPGESIVMQATATDDVALSRVEFYDGATLLGTDTTVPYGITWNGATVGAHVLTAKAVDSASQTTTSTPVSVTVAANSTNTALTFDGVDDCVAMGAASELGAKSFTLECWMRVDGAGVTAGSGSGGITVYPIIDKGGAQADGSNVDCNYIFGVQADYKLAADFEDMNNGLNHPVIGVTALSTGVWHHCAATYDNLTGWWGLYIDGVLDKSLQITGGVNVLTPRYDSIQHFALGKATTSTGLALGAFKGLMDEVRVWNYARTAAEINATKNLEITGATGLIGRFGLNEGTGTSTGNAAGITIGKLTNGPVWNTTGFPSATIRSAVETFDSYANGAVITTIGGGGVWTIGANTVIDAGGVAASKGLGTSGTICNWKGQGFTWSTLPAGNKVAISMDFQSDASGKFDDDRVGWTITPDTATSTGSQLALQLDNNQEAGMVLYHNGTRNQLNALSGIKASTWYRFNVEFTRLTAISAGIVGTLTELDASGNLTGTPYVGAIADTSTFSNPPSATLFSGSQCPSFKNYNSIAGNADNASFAISTPAAGGPTIPTVTLTLTGSPMAEASGVATVTATLSAASASAVTVNLAFTGTATLNTDYTASANSITIAAGGTSGSLVLTAVQDSIYENPNETIIVDIDTVSVGATESGTQQVIATITDDDPAPADYVNFTGGTHAQNFDSLGANANGTVSQTPTGWFVGYDITAPAWTTNVTANDGTAAVDGTAGWNCGIAGTNPATDRALSIGNSSTAPAPSGNRSILLKLKNGTASAISSFTVAYDLEQWRSFNDAATPEKLTLAYSSDNVNWVDLAPAFSGTLPVGPGSNTARDGNDPVYRVANLGGVYTCPAAVAVGSYIYLRWYDTNESGIDGINGIDNFSFTVAATAPNAPLVVAPVDGATGVSTSPTLSVSVTDPNSDPMSVTFYGRANSAPAPGADFTIAVLPDTQFYAESYPATYTAQTQWIVNNRVARNIVYVTGEGDVVNAATDAQYLNAKAAYDILHTNGIPYGVPVGNHDSPPYTLFNTYFNAARFSGRTFYGGSYGTGYQNHYDLFSAGGMDFIVLSLEYNAGATPAIMTWANGILAANPTRRAIVVSHSLLQAGSAWPTSAAWSTDGGTAMFPALSANPNLFLMLCGHNHGTGRRREAGGSGFIDVLLADYQSDVNGGDGYLRTLEFSPANNVINVKTYSPTTSGSKTDGDNQFTLSYTMAATPPAFTVIGTNNNVVSGTQTNISWPGLTAGTTYEWYATASDGTTLTTGTTHTFTTEGVAPTPPTVTLGLSGSPLAEAAGVATLTATLSASHTLPVTVNLAFSGTARPPTDYTASANSIVVAAGSMSGSITLTAVQDSVYENPNETIIVDIASVTNGTESGSQTVTATITDDDAAPVNYRSFTGTAIAENFDGLGAGGTSVTALTGWDAGHFSSNPQQGTTGGTGLTPVTDPLLVDDGSHDTNGTPMLANFGVTGAADRALGSFARSTPAGDQYLQLAIKNDTASPIASFTLSYRGEEWRSSNATVQQLTVWYSNTSATSGFTAMGSGFDFSSPNNTGSNAAMDGNAAGNFTAISGIYTPASPIAPGSTFYIRWYDINDSGIVDDFFAIDDVTVTPAVSAQAQYVIVISVDGLGGTYLGKIFDGTAIGGPYAIPNFRRLKNEGASTLAAHCDNNNWETLPNHTSIMTARPRDNSSGFDGHNWSLNSDPTTTIHANKGSYVASGFDVAHDNGLRTGMYVNKSKFSLFHAYASYTGGSSYDAINGALDITGADNGRNKIDNTYIDTALGGVVVTTFISQQKTASPNRYAFIHINEPDANGHGSGWGSATWNSCVVAVDTMLGNIFKLIEQDVPAMIGKTAIVLTADHGNQDNPPTGADRYQVPFYVWGPGVSVGADLYTLNSSKRQVAATYPMTTYAGMQPVRNAEISNLALKLLGLGPIPGSTFDFAQDLVVTGAAANQPPTVSITSPTNGASVGASFTIAATAADSDGTITSVAFYDGSTLLNTDTVSPYSYSWSGASAGSHALTAVALDNGGLTSTSSVVNVTVAAANQPPTVSITSPTNGTGVGAGFTIAASAADSDGTITSVAFYDGSTLLNTDTVSPYSYSWSGPSVGSHALTAVAMDNGGLTTTSAVVSVTVVAAPNPRSYTGAAIAENFDGLGISGTVLTPLSGWDAGQFNPVQANQPGPGNDIATVTDTSVVVDDGTVFLQNNTASIGNLGTTGSSDRALGGMPKTASGDFYHQLAIKNDSGSPIISFALRYTGEQWASAQSSNPDSLTVWFSDNNFLGGFVTMGGAFTFTAPQINLNIKLDGNAAANRSVISGTFTPAIPIAPGNTFYIRWYDRNDPAQDHVLAIDDVTVTPVTPPTVTLGLSGSLLAEASGTATVTATLSAAYTQPVTANLAFSGTATPTTDYTASANSIVIAAGATSGSVTLTAVQDAVYENPNETIIVDIASVTNGTESGTQTVTATITDDDPAPAVTSFTAYNDCTDNSAGNPANTTLYRGSATTSGLLMDFDTGVSLPVNLSISASGMGGYAGTGGPMTAAATDAYNTFNGKVLFNNVAYYGPNWWMEARFTGLDAAKEYEFATSVNRGEVTGDYTNRFSKFTITDIDSSAQSSTAGVTVNSPTSVTFCTGYNTVNGYVARWTRIKCGSDGAFTVRVEDGGGVGKGYAFDGIMLRETTPANHVPTFAGYAMSGTTNQALSIYPSKILAAAADPDGDAISLTRVFGPSAQGGMVALTPTSVNYTPPAGYVGTDTFDVEITDAHGAKAWGSVTITLAAAATGEGQNLTDLTMHDGQADLVFRGIPGRSYIIQRSANMATWENLASVPAGADGRIVFTDPNPLVPNGFYRTKSN